MRLISAALVLAFGFALTAPAAEVALKDGRVLKTTKPYTVKGGMAVLTLADGRLVSVPVSEIDTKKTKELAAKAPEAPPAPEATPAAPRTLADAAKAKPTKKASVILTDSEVAPGLPLATEEEGKKAGPGDVTISGVSAKKVTGGYSIIGSVQNSGKAEVIGVGVTIEVIGDENKTLTTVSGQLAKDSLAPGEKSGFTAEVTIEEEAKNFRYVPTWQEKAPRVEKVGPGGPAAGEAPAAAGTPAPSPTPAPAAPAAPKAPEPEPTPRYVPQPDMAPPAANAPVGQPEQPGGAYLPRPSDGQPQPQPTRVP